MGDILQQTLNTLTTFPGNLVYHLILAFSAAGAFQAALNLWRSNGFPQGRRMVIGLSLLLGVRLVLFFGAGLAGKNFADPHSLLPVIDRSVTALSLILIIWLWAFPEPVRAADASTGLVALLTLSAAVLSLIWWQGSNENINFNIVWLNTGWEIYSMVLLLLGVILMLVRRPNAWGVGLTMLGILMVGHLFHLINPNTGGDFPAQVRLAQMAAYPLLLALPYRFQIPIAPEPIAQPPEPLIQERERYSISPQIFGSILSIGTQKTFPEVCNSLTETIAKAMLADICLALLPPNLDGQMVIQGGYDLIRQKSFKGGVFDGNEIPVLLAAMEKSLPLRLPASSTSRDLFSLGSKLNMGRPGHLLASFVVNSDQTPLLGIVLLSPYSNRGWSNEDKAFLVAITDGLAQFLQRTAEWQYLQDEIEKSQQDLQSFQTLLHDTQNENAGLRAELSYLSLQAIRQQNQKDVSSPEDQQGSLETIKRLEAENLRLEELIEGLLAETEGQPERQALEQLKAEFRLALEEIARLKSQLASADQDFQNIQGKLTEPMSLTDEKMEVFTSVAQDLRQPMSSIIGYTDLLLGESVGILGELQRKFLERVKASTERMQLSLDDLYQMATMEGEQFKLNPEVINLGNIIDEAILATSPQLRDRHIILRVDMPERLPRLQADRDALGQVFFHLLKNAGDASPLDGEILLRASTYKTDDQKEYVLVQVADQGGGIPTEDLPRVFSRLYRADNPLIEGLGETGVGLSIAKTLVEAHNGRIWVDSQTGIGSTFSVLIPLLNGSTGDSIL